MIADLCQHQQQESIITFWLMSCCYSCNSIKTAPILTMILIGVLRIFFFLAHWLCAQLLNYSVCRRLFLVSRWRNYISLLAWECQGVLQEELQSVSGDKEFWACPPQQLAYHDAHQEVYKGNSPCCPKFPYRFPWDLYLGIFACQWKHSIMLVEKVKQIFTHEPCSYHPGQAECHCCFRLDL